jgi:hypothetical protein
MRTRWFGDLSGEELDPPLRQLVEAAAEVLDRLQPASVAEASGLVDTEASAVVVLHARIPGCCLVLQVSEWSSSVGCWWSRRTDPGEGPATMELSAEFPLEPGGITRAAAWFERELRRPLLERVRRFGVAWQRDRLVVLDDEHREPLFSEWAPWWRRPSWALRATGERDVGWLAAPAPREEAEEVAADEAEEVAADEDAGLPTDRWLLGAAATAAVAAWLLAYGLPELREAAWVPSTVRALRLAAFALLFIWFGVAGLDVPMRVRGPVLAGLLLSVVRLALGFVARFTAPPSGIESALQALGLFLREWWLTLLGVAALACYLAAFLGVAGRGALRTRRGLLLVAVLALGWLADLAVDLRWLTPVPTGPDYTPAVTMFSVLVVATRAVAVGIAVALALVVLDRRAGLAPGTARVAVAGAALLVVAEAATVDAALLRLLLGRVPFALETAIGGATSWLALFVGVALVALAAAKVRAAPSPQDGEAAGVPAPTPAGT